MKHYFLGFILMVIFLTGCNTTPKEETNTIQQPLNADSQSDVFFIQRDGQPQVIEQPVEITQAENKTIRQTTSLSTPSLSLDGENMYLQDINTREIFADTLTTESIISWLDNPQSPDTKEKFTLPRLEIQIQGTKLVIPGAAGLKDHIAGRNTRIETEGNDLVIRPGSQTYKENTIIVKETLPRSYRITNPQDWYNSEESFLLQGGQYSLISLSRGSELQSVAMTYGGVEIGELYQNTWNGYTSNYGNPLEISEKTSFLITPKKNDSEARAYHVIFGNDKTSHNRGSRQADMLLRDFTETKKSNLNVSQFTALDEGRDGWSVTTTDDQHQGVLIVENSHAYLFLMNKASFTASIERESDYGSPYTYKIESNMPLNPTIIQGELHQLFGTIPYSFTSERSERYYQGTFEPQPNTIYKKTLTVENIYGQKTQATADFSIKDIHPKAIRQNIVSNNTISILPPSGSFKDILVQYKNIPSFSVKTQACTIQSMIETNSYKGAGLENYLFDCQGDVQTTVVSPKDEVFSYWKTYRTAVPVAQQAGQKAFKVFFTDAMGKEQSHYAVQAQNGLWLKVAGQKVYAWAFDLQTGKPVNGKISLTNLKNERIGEVILTQGQGVFSLPAGYTEKERQRRHQTLLAQLNGDIVLVNLLGNNSVYEEMGMRENNNQRYLSINSALEIKDVADNITQRGQIPDLTIFGYTDRGLYKANDVISFGGFVRNPLIFDNLDYLKGKKVTVMLRYPTEKEPLSVKDLALDEFGGFAWSFMLGENDPLGDYVITYSVGDEAYYSHNIKVQEYKKPTFDTEINRDTKNNNITLTPRYLFGEELGQYDALVTYSLEGNTICSWYCGRWDSMDTKNSYTNLLLGETQKISETKKLIGLAGTSSLPLMLDSSRAFDQTLKISAVIKDTLTQETQSFTEYVDIPALTTISLAGYPSQREYNTQKDINIAGSIKQSGSDGEIQNLIDRNEYKVYFRSYDYDYQKGLDGSLYYLYDNAYSLLQSGVLPKTGDFDISLTPEKNGEYLIRILSRDKNDNIIGENQKTIQYYGGDSDEDMLGVVPNNYTLSVNTPPANYKAGDNLPLDLMPYKKGARVVITVERGQYILDTYSRILDGSQLTIPLKESYIPQATISVMMIQGQEQEISQNQEQHNNTETEQTVRSEPRFFVGYTTANIDSATQKIDIEIQSDKKEYAPGDDVTLTIKTTHNKKEIDARVSLAVIDKALAQLYYIKKEPLPWLYNSVGTNISNYTNMKLLYQSLRAFANDGSKGGSGIEGQTMFHYIRDDLRDMAFWDAAVITKGGEATVTFTAPENLTTWMIDAIAISKDSKLGTTQQDIIVKKDLIVEANAPSFMSLGDTLEIPLKVISLTEKKQEITGSAWLTNDRGDIVKLGSFEMENDTAYTIPVSVPYDRYESTSMTLSVQGESDSDKDGIQQTIEIRKEGFVMIDSAVALSATGILELPLVDALTRSQEVSFSTLPRDLMDDLLIYVPENTSYPQGIMSTLAIKHLIQQLREKGYTSSLIDAEDRLTRFDAYNANNAFARLMSYQHTDGGFFYPQYYETNETPTSDYGLSLDVLKYLWALPDGVAKENMLKKLMSYLSKSENTYEKNTDNTQRYTYLAIKGEKIALTASESASLENISLSERSLAPLLRYIVAVGQDENKTIQNQRRAVATIPEDMRDNTLSDLTALSRKLTTLLSDENTTQQERDDIYLSLLSQRNNNNHRRMSQHTQIDIVKALLMYADTTLPTERNCDYSIGNTTGSVTIFSGENTLSGKGYGAVSWDCDSTILASTRLPQLPTDTDLINPEQKNIENMTWGLSETVNIGESVDVLASFTTTQGAENLTVEVFVPSNHAFLETQTIGTVGNNQGWYGLPFTINDGCYPDRYEVRFDRVVLEYTSLAPGTCTLSIPALKTYEGDVSLMPLKISEKKRGFVYGRMKVLDL